MRITSKGQVTIPQEIREQCGLLPHTQVRFVDSNVILDVITADPRWQAWSEEQLSRWLDRGPLLINPIVYAEIAFACEAIETVDDLLPDHLDVYRLIPREAAFLAARAHAEYRARPAA
jgi:predicted nucleic acid-binding protein